jgi:3'(2'), 5'-bisphosphate nucleotidase
MSLYEEEMAVARNLALAAGHIIMYHYRGKAHVNQRLKTIQQGNEEIFREPVTLADKDADAFIRKELCRIFPADGVISEEGTETIEHLQQQMNRRRYWCVDPLDGTHEFLEDDIFEFCVMIALVDGDVPVLGVTRNPGKEEEYYAAAGKGAYVARAGEVHRLKVSPVERLAYARLMASRTHLPRDLFKIMSAAGIPDENIVRMGSVGVKVGMLSEARADLYLHPRQGMKIWDVAAPEAILRESGGRMSDSFGRPIIYRRTLRGMRDLFIPEGILASNGQLHEPILHLLNDMFQKGEISIQS